MNPPFERKYGCLTIVNNILLSLPPHTKCAFILPDKKLEKDNGTKLLKHSTLEKIIKLPEKIFSEGVTTSIFIFESGTPQNNKEIFTCYIEDDGLETVKNQGRQDIKDRNNFVFKLEVKLKVLEKNLDKALELMEQMLLSSDFTDTKRLGELVAQIKARLQANLSSSGHLVAAMRSMSSFSRYALYQDELKGIAFYRSICCIEKELSESPKSVSDKLAAIAKKLFARNRMLISFTGNNEAYGNAKPSLEKVIAGFDKMSAIGNQAEVHFNTAKEAFIDASQIQYVAKTGDFICEGYEYTGALRLLRIILSYDYLWINVRVKGGAYGCMNTFLRSGESYFVSYRDPNLSDTLDVYDRIPEYIKSFSPDERDMTKYIIGTFSALDTPMNPEAKGSRSLSAYLEGITYEQIQKERNEILNAQPEDIRRLADLVEAVLKKDSICVIGNENMIKESAGLFENVEKLI